MAEWRRPFLAIVASVLAVEAAMVALDMGPETLLVAAVVVTLATTIWSVRSLTLPATTDDAPVVAIAESTSPDADRRVRALRSSIVLGRGPGSATEQLRDTLVDLIDDQLLHVHAIDREARPDDAHAVLPPTLVALVDDPDDSVALAALADATHVERIVSDIERL